MHVGRNIISIGVVCGCCHAALRGSAADGGRQATARRYAAACIAGGADAAMRIADATFSEGLDAAGAEHP
jgi:hypothetical protein